MRNKGKDTHDEQPLLASGAHTWRGKPNKGTAGFWLILIAMALPLEPC